MRAAIYVRVSTLEQAEEGYSIEEQIDKLEKFCEVKNWSIASIYKDGGFSGSNTDRPGLSQLISDAKRKKFECVLVYKLDRLSRSQKDTLFLIEDVFSTNNISFVSINENFDTSTPFGKAMIGILAVFAQLEREQIKERMVMGKVGRAKSGKAMSWSKVPFGYTYENDTYKINPIQAEVVKQIFTTYLGGMSITKLRDTLNKEGHIGKDIDWSYRTIRKILDSPIYAGFNRYYDQLFEGNHEAIISRDLYDRVQQELIIRQKEAYEKNNNPRPFQAKYLLSGLLKCGVCGSNFSVNMYAIRKDGSRHRYYKCYSRIKQNRAFTNKQNPNGCDSPNYSLNELESYVLSSIENLRVNPTQIDKLSSDTSEVDATAYETQIKKLDGSLKKIVELYIDGGVPKEVLDSKRAKIQQEKDALEKKIEDLGINKSELSAQESKRILANVTTDIRELSYEEQKVIVRNLISKVYVYPNRINITWKFEQN